MKKVCSVFIIVFTFFLHFFNVFSNGTKVEYRLNSKEVFFNAIDDNIFKKTLKHGLYNFSIDMKGFKSPKGSDINICAYDVEHDGRQDVYPKEWKEIDKVFINSKFLGTLKGGHKKISFTSFKIGSDILNDSKNVFSVNVDTLQNGWICALCYAELNIPFNIDLVNSQMNSEDILIRKFNAKTGDTKEKKNEAIKIIPEKDTWKLKYKYEIDSWPSKPNWKPRVECKLKVTDGIHNISINSDNVGWKGETKCNLKKSEWENLVGENDLIVSMKIYDSDGILIKKISTVHKLSLYPIGNGKIIYHSYTNYDKWDSQLYQLDLSDNSLSCISSSWNVDNAMNAHFSPDGKSIVFMGDITGDGKRNWDIFLYTFGKQNPVNLTSNSDLREEDPKFSPDGKKIVFKEGHWDSNLNKMVFDIKEMHLDGTIENVVTKNADEESMPYYTADGKKILYAKGLGPDSDIYSIDVNGNNNVPIQNISGIQEYYPIVRNDGSYIYTRWVSSKVLNDQLYLKKQDSSASISLPFNDVNNNYSDGYPVGDDYVLFSSTREGSKGKYDLYIANIMSGQTWSLDKYNSLVNTKRSELGGTFYSSEF